MKKPFLLVIILWHVAYAFPQSNNLTIVADSVPKLEVGTTQFVAKNSNPFALVAGGSKRIGCDRSLCNGTNFQTFVFLAIFNTFEKDVFILSSDKNTVSAQWPILTNV